MKDCSTLGSILESYLGKLPVRQIKEAREKERTVFISMTFLRKQQLGTLTQLERKEISCEVGWGPKYGTLIDYQKCTTPSQQLSLKGHTKGLQELLLPIIVAVTA